jgi:hypothetical protein
MQVTDCDSKNNFINISENLTYVLLHRQLCGQGCGLTIGRRSSIGRPKKTTPGHGSRYEV